MANCRVSTPPFLIISARPPCYAMAPKARGGRGASIVQDYVRSLWQQGLGEDEVRQQLKRDGYAATRISQLLKATRPTTPAAPAAPPEARPPAADPLRDPAPSASTSARAASDGCTAVGGSGPQGEGRRGAAEEDTDGESSDKGDDAHHSTAAPEGSSMSEDDDGNDLELGVYDNATYWARFGPEATLGQAELDYLDGRSVKEDDEAEQHKAEDGQQDLLNEEMLDFEAHGNSSSSSEDTADEADAPEARPQLQPPPPEAPPAQQAPKRQRLSYKQPPPPAYAEPEPPANATTSCQHETPSQQDEAASQQAGAAGTFATAGRGPATHGPATSKQWPEAACQSARPTTK